MPATTAALHSTTATTAMTAVSRARGEELNKRDDMTSEPWLRCAWATIDCLDRALMNSDRIVEKNATHQSKNVR
jgi:hypothetical protein